MRAPIELRSFLGALAAGLLLGACGSGLYSATGIPQVDTGGGANCNAAQNVCGGTCFDNNDVTHCGPSCTDCTASTGVPATGQPACLGTGAATACSYTCSDGFLKCGSGATAGCCGATAVAAAEKSTCALLTNGDVACWGANDQGQVGDGATAAAQTTPKLVPLGAAAIGVATGGSHACAVLSNGAVACWGANESGQVTGTAGSAVLSPAASPVSSGAVEVAAGASHSCALLSSGAVRCWGSDAAGQLGPGPGTPLGAGSGATVISAGRNHTCVVAGSAVRCWGSNAAGQLGANPSGGIAVPLTSGIQSVAAGADQTCAVTGTSGQTTPDDSLRCWGSAFGTTPAGDAGWWLLAQQTTPAVPLKRGPATDPSAQATIRFAVDFLAAGGQHVCVHRSLEFLECLGANDRGQLGGALLAAGETVTVTLPAAAAKLAAGAAHTCAALSDNRLRCWGANDAGQIGNESTADASSPVAPVGK